MPFYGYSPSYTPNNTYQPYQPLTMQNYQQQQQMQQAQPQTTNRWEWVQGEMGAKSYLVAPNTTVLLLDSEAKKFYLKSADASGMPLPLRVFEFSEVTQKVVPTTAAEAPKPDYATKAELDALSERIDRLTAAPAPKTKGAKTDE